MLLVLVTGQLVIAGQLGREVHLWSIGFFLGAGDRDNFEEVLVDETTGNGFALFQKAMVVLEMKAFPCFQE